MPVEAPEAPTAGAAANVSTIAPERAASNRDSRNPRDRQTPQRSQATKEARAKVDAIAKEMAAKSFLLGEKADAAPAPEAKKEATAPTPAPKAEPAKEKAEPTAEEKAATATKAKKVSAAKRALALDGYEAEDIEEMFTKDEAKALKLGEHRAKNQADVNRNFEQLRKAATSPTGARDEAGRFAPKTEETQADETVPPTATKAEATASKIPAATGDKEIDAMIESAKEEIGEPATKLLKVITSTLLKRVELAAQDATATGSAMSKELLHMQIVDRINQQHPEPFAAAPERFDEVVENLRAFIASGRFSQGQIHKAIDSAIYTEFGPPDSVRKAQRDALNRQQAADKGQIDSGRGDKGTTSSDSSSSQTPKQQLQMAANLFAKNTGANLDALHAELMGKIKPKGRAA